MPRPKRSKIVGYRRTSTDDQRLGIEAQDARLRDIAQEKGCEIARLFTEHESGGDNARPELARALAHARRIDAYLVVAKLDRLARDATFLMTIYDGQVPVIFGDLPEVERVRRQPAHGPDDGQHRRVRTPEDRRADQGSPGRVEGPGGETGDAAELDP